VAVIEVEGLTKRWGTFAAVDNLSLSVNQGECYAFLGRNGAGKSTTARMLLAFLKPTSGKAVVLGGHGADTAVRSRIGYLPGDLNLPRSMTGADAIQYFGSLGTAPDRTTIDDIVQRLDANLNKPFHKLSTGNKRKIGLVLAFMTKPDLLVLDEPTNGLDPVLQDAFRELLLEYKANGTTVWLTSHVMSDVEHVADRVGLIDAGKLKQQVSMEELRSQTGSEIILTFEAPVDPSPFAALAGVSGADAVGNTVVLKADAPVTEVLATAARLGAVEIRTHQRELDDIFLETYAADQEGR
jgi:ABC-2 type transport system ATP-binding protein